MKNNMTRVILYTRKNDVGKTSIFAANTLCVLKMVCAPLSLSTNSDHSFGDSFDIQLKSEPRKINNNL